MHDFVRETSLTTEEWMYANALIFLFGYSFHFRLDLVVGRLLISSPRQGRCALIFAKVRFQFCFINDILIFILSQSLYCYLTLLESLLSSIRSIMPNPLVRLRPPSLDLSILTMRMKVNTSFLR